MTKSDGYASLISKHRFGAGPIAIFTLLAMMTILLFRFGFKYLAILPVIVAILIFIVKSMEVIKLEEPVSIQIVGKKCYVVKQINKYDEGVVRLYTDKGALSLETWSARSERDSTIEAGTIATVTDMRGIYLMVEQELV